MYITWATSPLAGGGRTLKQASRLARLPPQSAPKITHGAVSASCSTDVAGPQQQFAALAQDAAARSVWLMLCSETRRMLRPLQQMAAPRSCSICCRYRATPLGEHAHSNPRRQCVQRRWSASTRRAFGESASPSHVHLITNTLTMLQDAAWCSEGVTLARIQQQELHKRRCQDVQEASQSQQWEHQRRLRRRQPPAGGGSVASSATATRRQRRSASLLSVRLSLTIAVVDDDVTICYAVTGVLYVSRLLKSLVAGRSTCWRRQDCGP